MLVHSSEIFYTQVQSKQAFYLKFNFDSPGVFCNHFPVKAKTSRFSTRIFFFRQRPLRRRRHRLRGPDPGQSVGAKRQKLRTSVESDRHQRQ
jgi:hypothetical protein